MIAYKNLKDILDLTIRWEKKLKDFYDVAEQAFLNKDSKKAVEVLRDNLLRRLEVLQNINFEDFGKTEWIRYAADYKEDELIPIKRVSRNSEPKNIFKQILEYEVKLRDFYSGIAQNLITAKQKELFQSLASFKDEQIFEISRFMERYDLSK